MSHESDKIDPNINQDVLGAHCDNTRARHVIEDFALRNKLNDQTVGNPVSPMNNPDFLNQTGHQGRGVPT